MLSLAEDLPSIVLIIRWISSDRIRSNIFGFPSVILFVKLTDKLFFKITFAVPEVAINLKPKDIKSSHTSIILDLSLSLTEIKTLPLLGKTKPDAIWLFAKAMENSLKELAFCS